jgi:hypothetical protein
MENLFDFIDETQPLGLVLGVILITIILLYIRSKLPKIPSFNQLPQTNEDNSKLPKQVIKVTTAVEHETIGLTNPGVGVPVTMGWNHPSEVIGTAWVNEKDGSLVADMEIYDMEMTKYEGLPDYIKGLYPSIGGRIEEMDEDGVIKKFKLFGVALHAEPNADPTIKAL